MVRSLFRKVRMRFFSQTMDNHMLQCRCLCEFTAVIHRNKRTKIVSNNAEHPFRLFAKRAEKGRHKKNAHVQQQHHINTMRIRRSLSKTHIAVWQWLPVWEKVSKWKTPHVVIKHIIVKRVASVKKPTNIERRRKTSSKRFAAATAPLTMYP